MLSKTYTLIMNLTVLLCLVSVIIADTVHFTNSQKHFERSFNSGISDSGYPKTYKLEVAGSEPITIIETDPENRQREQKSLRESRASVTNSHYNERKTKDYVVPGSTHEQEIQDRFDTVEDKDSSRRFGSGRCFGPSCHEFDGETSKKTVYSPELLNKFLAEYAEKIKNADQRTKDRLQQMETTTPFSNKGILIADKLYQKKKITEKVDIYPKPDEGKKSSWDFNDLKKHKNPFDDPEGWVALEAIPWSKSKISKWSANTHKTNRPNNFYSSPYGGDKEPSDFNDRFSSSGYGKPTVESESDIRPFNNNYQFDKPDTNEYRPSFETSQVDNDWPSDPTPKPSWNRPSYKPSHYHSLDWGQETNKKPHRPGCHDHDHDIQNTHYDDDDRRISNRFGENDGIVTDGRPGDFPPSSVGYKPSQSSFRKPTQVVYADIANSNHPSTHPSKGDGQWVLLSTTKGYQFPKSRQRSLSVAPSTMNTHRVVRLTVLPVVNGSKENMTTSHGGLLEVEANFQTVDESRNTYEKEIVANATKLRRYPVLRRVMATDPSPDSSAVMAAVGAGLVPATMAMIMPMVLGRRKRSVSYISEYNNYYQNVTQHPKLDYENTLQRSL